MVHSNFTGGDAADANGLIGGLEVCMWSEVCAARCCIVGHMPNRRLLLIVVVLVLDVAQYVDATNFISRIWPRAAAVAERAWSPKTVTDVDDARERIAEFRCKLLTRGIGAEPITNGGSSTELAGHNFCEQEWNPRYNPPWTSR